MHEVADSLPPPYLAVQSRRGPDYEPSWLRQTREYAILALPVREILVCFLLIL